MSDILGAISDLSPENLAVFLIVYAGIKAVELVMGDHWVKTALEEKRLYDALVGSEFEGSRIELREDIRRRIHTTCSQRGFVHFVWHYCGATRFALLLTLLFFIRILFKSNDWTEVLFQLSGVVPRLAWLFTVLLMFDLALYGYDKVLRGRLINKLMSLFKKFQERLKP